MSVSRTRRPGSDPDHRGGHVTLRRNGFRAVTATLWEEGVIPDYRDPDGIRIGVSPLSTSFGEVVQGMQALCDAIERLDSFK